MRELLLAVQVRIESSDPVWLRDCFITTDEQVMPAGARLPCVGIKDGKITIRRLTCGVEERIMQIHLVVWAPGGKDAAQVLGDATQPGVLAMAAQLEQILRDDTLSIEGMIDAAISGQEPSRLYITESGKGIQQKKITMTYTRQR